MLAKRMGVAVDDRRLEMAVAVWSDHPADRVRRPRTGSPTGQNVDTDMLVDRLNDTYKQFTGICSRPASVA